MPIFNYSQAFWGRIAQEEQARQASYRHAMSYYGGAQSMPLRIKANQPNDNVILNLYSYIIDKGVSFLFGKPVDIELTEGETTAAEKYLSQVYQANHFDSFIQDVALNGALCGHCFVEIQPRAGNVPRLINLDPAIVRPQWSPDDIDKRLWYKIEYEALDENAKQVFKKRLIEWNEPAARWEITQFERRQYDPQFRQIGDVVLWNYEFPPILDWKNLPSPNTFFGKRDIEQVAPQDGINFVASNIQRIIRFHGHPKTIGKGFNAQGVNIGPDDMFIIPSENGDVKNLEMQSDLGATRAYFEMLVDLFLQLHHTPNMNPTKISIGALSGFALRVLYGDLLALTEKKRLMYGDALIELVYRLLVLGGFEAQTPTLHWQSPLPENAQEQTTVLTGQMDAGLISKETARATLGVDNEVENERLTAERLQGDSVGASILRAFNAGQVVSPGETNR